MVDTLVSGASASRRVGSTPIIRTKAEDFMVLCLFCVFEILWWIAYQLSERNGEAGIPKLLKSVAVDQFFIPYLTAIGLVTSALVTFMLFLSFCTIAVAG